MIKKIKLKTNIKTDQKMKKKPFKAELKIQYKRY